jgi:aryl-alcohol dehydrogenase-like predicted oxidoreductase
MKYTYLGRTGLKVSRLCLGTMNFGNYNDEKESFKIMDAALAAGINFFDTADNYGKATHNEGITEKIIGRWFAQGGGRRESVVLASKVHEEMWDPHDGPNSAGGLSLYKIRRHLDASMKRLQTDHLEIYYMHHIDRNVTWDEMWDAFHPLVQQG